MTLINIDESVFTKYMEALPKSLSKITVTKTTDNLYGDETLTDGATTTISGTFFRKEDVYVQDKPGLLQNADAILMVKTSVTLNKNDKITYEGETYRIDKVVTRRLGTTAIHKTAQLFRVS